MLKYAVAAAALLAAPLSSAAAAPAGSAAVSAGAMPAIQLVDHRGPRRPSHAHRPAPRPHFRPGGRYRSAPHGWRSYRTRPGDWRTRGCVLVGPLWFCP